MPSSLFGPRSISPAMSQQAPLTLNTQQTNTGFQLPANFSQIKNLMNIMNSGGNISGMVQTMLQNSPEYQTINGLLQKHNGDARAAFYDMAQQKGVDPNQVLSMLR